MNHAEILSPAGSREMLNAAVRCGADAVYFGAREFSARRHAENFDLQEMRDAIAFCHVRGVKAYLALNIILKESELSHAVQLAQEAYNAGIDGAIVADLGLAAVLRRLLPELPLHASTQLSVLSPAALPARNGRTAFCIAIASVYFSMLFRISVNSVFPGRTSFPA